jgi:hypothetical protein
VVRGRLARLERAAWQLDGGRRCPRCGGTRGGGVARIPVVTFNGEGSLGVFGPDGRCATCGSVPSHVVEIFTPLRGKVRLGR